jgi:hypothetical protein
MQPDEPRPRDVPPFRPEQPVTEITRVSPPTPAAASWYPGASTTPPTEPPEARRRRPGTATTVLALLGRVPVVTPQFIARQVSKVLWATQLVGSPPSFLDFLLYLCVADGAKAKRELGVSARLSIKRTILDFLGVAPEDGATDVARAQA